MMESLKRKTKMTSSIITNDEEMKNYTDDQLINHDKSLK